jgi:NAD(P)-dependent dehydrogenase (short-subunit alcohol dehydrogenase family)
MAASLHLALPARGIRAPTIDPGYAATETQRAFLGEDDPIYRLQVAHGAPPSVPAAMLVWLLTTDEGRARSGESFHAPRFVKEHGLVPGWPPPKSVKAAKAPKTAS